jgi:vitamin B12 transporter
MTIALCATVPTGAQQPAGAPAPSDDDAQRHFETVVVTASDQEERVGDLPVTIQAFDRDEIAASPAQTITEFLSERGVAFFSTWTPAQTQINIRGGATDGQGRDFSSQVVVLINGRRSGTANVSKLGLHDVERIEVLRGPGSLLYGSQAIGGVINLITKSGLSDPGPFLRLNAGSFGLVDGVAQFGATNGRWDYFVSAHGARRGDYDAGSGAVESPQRNTGYEQRGGLFALGYTVDAYNRVAVTSRTDGMYDAGFRGSSWDWDNVEDRTNRSTDVTYTGERPSGGARWEIQTSQFRDLDDFRWGSENGGVDLDHNTRRQTAWILRGSATLDTVPGNALQVGTDSQWSSLRNDRAREPVPGRTVSQIAPFDNNSDSRNIGLFFEDVHRLADDRLILRGGLRYDAGQHEILSTPNVSFLRERTETYDALTYRVGATVRPTPDTALRIAAGTGYRAPTPTELAVDYTTVLGSQIVGNPDLEPERTTSIEVGAAVEGDRFWVDLALFRNDITNRIAAVAESPDSTRRIFQNRSESDVVGLELQSRIDVAELSGGTDVWLGVNGIYNFRMRDQDAVEQNLSTDRIERLYESQGSLTLGVTNPVWSARLAGTYYGSVWYDTEERLLMPQVEAVRNTIHRKSPFWTWRLSGRRALGSAVWLTASIDNLFDENNHPLFIATNDAPVLSDPAFSNGGVGNSLPGRAFLVGLELRP